MVGYKTFDVLGKYCYPDLGNLPDANNILPAYIPLGQDNQYKQLIVYFYTQIGWAVDVLESQIAIIISACLSIVLSITYIYLMKAITNKIIPTTIVSSLIISVLLGIIILRE